MILTQPQYMNTQQSDNIATVTLTLNKDGQWWLKANDREESCVSGVIRFRNDGSLDIETKQSPGTVEAMP